MKKEYLEVLKELKKNPNLRILIVEDSKILVDGISTILQMYHPTAVIDIFEKEDFPSIEIFIKEKGYHLVILGGGRTKWPPHPVAGIMAVEIIKVIKQRNPEVVVMFVSTDLPTVEMMAKRGADISYLKQDLHELFLQV